MDRLMVWWMRTCPALRAKYNVQDQVPNLPLCPPCSVPSLAWLSSLFSLSLLVHQIIILFNLPLFRNPRIPNCKCATSQYISQYSLIRCSNLRGTTELDRAGWGEGRKEVPGSVPIRRHARHNILLFRKPINPAKDRLVPHRDDKWLRILPL